MICCKVKSFYNISILLDDYLCHSFLFALISLVEMSYGGFQFRVGNRKWMLSRLFVSLRSALSERGGVHPWSLAFIRMARLESVIIRRICVICVPSCRPVYSVVNRCSLHTRTSKNVLQHVLIIKCLRYTFYFSSKKVFELFGQN